MAEEKDKKADSTDSNPTEMDENEIDENLEGTFPASDPPSWTLGTNHREKPKGDH